jgi:acyl dehydratase
MEKKVLYFEDVREGDEAPPVVVANISRTQIVKYAGASGDFNPIHHDELYAIRAGNDRVFAMGMMTAGFLSHMVTDWVGDGNLRKYKVRFATRIWPGDTVACKGKITKKYTRDGKNYVEADVFAENQNSEKAIVGAIVAELPSRAGT